MNISLRDYQQKAVEGISTALLSNRSTLVVLPTGCGKTVVFASVINNYPGRVIVLAHREELIMQAKAKIEAITGKASAIEMAEQKATDFFGAKAPVVVSTIQTQNSRCVNFNPQEFDLVVVDEAHHATSPSYRKVLNYYLEGNPKCQLLGVTATPDRHDQQALGKVFDSVAFEYGIDEAITDGWLVPIRQQLVVVNSLDYSKVSTTAGDLNGKELAAVMEEEENLQRIAAPTLELCKDKRAIIFAASIKQAERLAEILNRSQFDSAAWLCGETDKDLRRNILSRFKRGELRFLCNVGVLTEGFDDAGVEAVVMARPTKSRALYAQMAGRGTRPLAEIADKLGTKDAVNRRAMIASSAKPSCLIIDFVGNAGRHKLITSADILGGKYEDAVVEAAKRKLASNPNGGEVGEALANAKQEIEARKAKEAAARKAVIAEAKYATRTIDAFDRYDLCNLADDGANLPKINERDNERLRSAFKKEYPRFTDGQKRFLANEMHRRARTGQSTFGQERFLAKRGICAPMRAGEASRMISKISYQEGWGR